MNALERAQRDEQAGDLGTARQRLRSYVATVGYSEEVCERIARLSMRMGDPVEAGRWYLLCRSEDAAAPESIARYKASCGNQPRQIFVQLPLKVRQADRSKLPPEVRNLVETFGFPPDHLLPKKSSKLADTVFWWGCAAVIILIVVSTCVGIFVIARSLIRLVI